MSGYTKLFSDIVDSSIWKEPPDVCKVWITLLALCDADGYVRGSPGWLAGKAHVTLESCQTALRRFEAPDPFSRTPDHEGRRIETLPDGWLVLNYLAFRDRLSNDPSASATRERVRRHRERYRALRNVTSVTPAVSASVVADVSSPKEEVQEKPRRTKVPFVPPTLGEVAAYVAEKGYHFLPEEFMDYYQANGWVQGKALKPIKDWRACCGTFERTWKKYHAPTQPNLAFTGGKSHE